MLQNKCCKHFEFYNSPFLTIFGQVQRGVHFYQTFCNFVTFSIEVLKIDFNRKRDHFVMIIKPASIMPALRKFICFLVSMALADVPEAVLKQVNPFT